MDDRHDPNLILGYVEGELTKAQRKRFEALLAEDAALASLVGELRRDRAALREAPPAAPPRDLTEAAMSSLERQLLLDPDAALPRNAGGSGGSGGSKDLGGFRGLGSLLTYGSIAAVLVLAGVVVLQSVRNDLPVALSEDAPSASFDIAQAPLEAQRRPSGVAGTRRAATSDSPPALGNLSENAAKSAPARAYEDARLSRQRAQQAEANAAVTQALRETQAEADSATDAAPKAITLPPEAPRSLDAPPLDEPLGEAMDPTRSNTLADDARDAVGFDARRAERGDEDVMLFEGEPEIDPAGPAASPPAAATPGGRGGGGGSGGGAFMGRAAIEARPWLRWLVPATAAPAADPPVVPPLRRPAGE